ncbi:MAG: 4Fe-4S binding protein [Oscillospiraceae bacterium]|nr:4Fe-4S binding protein [Oscillospiraceae bacterium]
MHELMSLEMRSERFANAAAKHKNRVVICAGTGCIANGAIKIYNRFMELAQEHGFAFNVALEEEAGHDMGLSMSGCQGFCQMGPLVHIVNESVLYVKVSLSDVEEIVTQTLLGGQIIDRLVYRLPSTGEAIPDEHHIPFYARQRRLLLELCGNIDACSIDEYIYHGGYFQARKAVLEMTDKEICTLISDSGLRGRGGGGFPTGRKWDITRQNESDIKYVICNGDEGDPGAFMDRCLLEGNPHSILEGMIIAAQAVNAQKGYIYVRMEYPLACQRLKLAIEQAQEAGVLGDNIFGSGKCFKIHLMEGAGAFVCGEETALIASIEGKRGMPTLKPPYPAQVGLFGKPTVINNVETLAAVALIMRMGVDEYTRLGTATAKGTKTFALTGHVANTGLIEVPFGVTLREIIKEIGGGVITDDGVLVTDADGNLNPTDYKAVQIGGPSGGCLTQEHMDMPLDYDNLNAVGAMVGSGGVVVMNQNTCMVKIARYFMQFTQNESCGKCVVCREGTRQMLSMLDEISAGEATVETVELLEALANTVRVGSLCALGKTAPNPIISVLKYFREEVMAHVVEKRCPTGNCEALLTYVIIPEKCKGCTICARKCPVQCIHGEKGTAYTIDGEKCIKCGACADVCKFEAIARC